MDHIDRFFLVIRFFAASCLLIAAVAFGDVQEVGAWGDGGCHSQERMACVTSGDASVPYACNDGVDDCTTCEWDPGELCYHGDSEHLEGYREVGGAT